MEEAALQSKFEQMAEILRSAIEAGEFAAGARIDSEHTLSRRYGISRNTVREAIGALVQQGYVTRTQGRGTFVANRSPAQTATDIYAIFLQTHAHVFEAETRALVQALQHHRALPVVFDVRDLRSREQTEEILGKLLDRGVAGVVIEDALLEILLGMCGPGRKLPLIASVNRRLRAAVPGISVITDFELGTRIGTEHLLGLGRRDILFVIHLNPYLAPGQSPDQEDGEYGQVARGYSQALADAGLGGKARFFFIEHEFAEGADERERLGRLLAGPDRPDAVFAYGDYRAKHVIDIATDAGLRVPEDLAVLGYWNTPWADLTRVPLTSISIREDEIARLAVEKLMAAREQGEQRAETAVVKPELIVRASCGARET